MKTLRLIVLLVLTGFASLGITGGVESEAQPHAMADFRQRLQPINSLGARFVQTIYGVDGYEIQQTQGVFQVARPGKIRWISEAPFEQWIIADGATLWIYDPDLEQVSVRAFQHNLEKTPAVLFVGNLDGLEESYQVIKVLSEGREIYSLYPKTEDNLYTKLSLTFYGQQPVSMELWDTLEQRTEVLFQNPQVNIEFDPAMFVFEPPPGVDILVDE